MGEADRLHLILGFGGRAAEGTGGNVGCLVCRVVLRDRLGRIDREESRRAAIARRCRDRVRGDLAVDRSRGEIGIRLLVADGVRGFAGRELDDLELVRIDAVLRQDHLEQIDIGLGAAGHADTVPGELRNFGDLRAGFLALGLGRRRHPQHNDVLAQRRHGLGIFRHFEIAANDREIGLALAKRLRARGRAIGLHRTQADPAVRLRKGLGQRVNDLDVIAVRRTDRDPQAHRPHRKVVSTCERADHGEDPGERDEHHLPLRRTRRRRCRRPDKLGVSGHRSRKHSLQVQIHAANMVRPTIVAKFPVRTGLHLRHGYRRPWTSFAA